MECSDDCATNFLQMTKKNGERTISQESKSNGDCCLHRHTGTVHLSLTFHGCTWLVPPVCCSVVRCTFSINLLAFEMASRDDRGRNYFRKTCSTCFARKWRAMIDGLIRSIIPRVQIGCFTHAFTAETL